MDAGCPVSACHRIATGRILGGTGTTSTLAPGGRCSAVNAADQPRGSGVVAAAGNGPGSNDRQASTASVSAKEGTQARSVPPSALSTELAGAGPTPRTVSRPVTASNPSASRTAAAPSIRIDSRSGSIDDRSWCSSSQCQGRFTAGSGTPRVCGWPPNENTARTTSVTAAALTAGRRQPTTGAAARTTIIGQPRYARYSVRPAW